MNPMATLLRSRTYLGSILKQGCITDKTRFNLVLAPQILLRNASTSKLKSTPKPAEKAPSTKPKRKTPPPSPPPFPGNEEKTTGTSPSISSTRAPTQNAPEQQTESDSSGKRFEDMSEAERERELQIMLQYSELLPTVDFFGQGISSTLDVMIPYPNVRYLSISKKKWHQATDNLKNNLKNAMALNMLSEFDAIPGMVVPTLSFWSRLRHKFKLFGSQSTKPDGLLAPFRQIVLELYEELNTAVASRKERDIQRLTTQDYQSYALGLMKSSLKNNPNGRIIWQLHRVVEPVQVLSFRVTQGHYGANEPKFGNRLLVHALVKFDTEQSLEVYDRKGQPLHTPADGGKNVVSTDAERKVEKWRIPAVKRRVQEYLVLEKKMWVQGPWVFREQMWPTWPLEEIQGSKTS